MKTVLNLRMDESVKDKLKIIAKSNSRSMAKQVEHFILIEQDKIEREAKEYGKIKNVQ